MDLRMAVIERDIRIDATAVCGGIDILVPSNVMVRVMSVPVLGGVSNKAPAPTEIPCHTLILCNLCLWRSNCKMKRKLILASASPRRKEILEQMGLMFTVSPCSGEEKLETEDPEEAVRTLALQKASEAAGRQTEAALVIGSDTVVAYDGRILGKPADEEEAAAMLRMLSGNTHMVYTGVAVIDAETKKTLVHFAEGTEVTMYPMTEQWIRSYVASGEPMDKAGAYAIQGGCMPFIREIRGEYTNVVGFPAAGFYQELLRQGIDLLSRKRRMRHELPCLYF